MPWGTLLLVTPTYLYTGALNISRSEPPPGYTHNPCYTGPVTRTPYPLTRNPCYTGARDLFTMPTNKLHKLILKFLIIIPKNIPDLELIFLKFQKI